MTMLVPKEMMAQGFSFVCSCCRHLARGVNGSGVIGCGVPPSQCGGPAVGMSFPSYAGPLSRDIIARHCFRCGNLAGKALHVNDGGFVGACKDHLKDVERLSPTGEPR